LGKNLKYNTFSILLSCQLNLIPPVSKQTKDFGHDSGRGEEKKIKFLKAESY
jgi:hypothetical protein